MFSGWNWLHATDLLCVGESVHINTDTVRNRLLSRFLQKKSGDLNYNLIKILKYNILCFASQLWHFSNVSLSIVFVLECLIMCHVYNIRSVLEESFGGAVTLIPVSFILSHRITKLFIQYFLLTICVQITNKIPSYLWHDDYQTLDSLPQCYLISL